MKKLILQMQMSVDGFVGAKQDHPWQLWEWGDDSGWDDELKQDFNAVFQAVDTILLSRKMAEEGYLTHWGNAARKFPQDPFYAFAQRIVEARKVVPSDRLKASRWERTSVVSGDLPREVDGRGCCVNRHGMRVERQGWVEIGGACAVDACLDDHGEAILFRVRLAQVRAERKWGGGNC